MESNKSTKKDNVQNFSIRSFLEYCLKHWKWIALSFCFFMVLSVTYVMRKEPVFDRHTDILIEDQDNGNASQQMSSAFSQMGLVSSKTNVYNELISFTSPAIMYEVVKRLELQTSYTWKRFPHNISLFGPNQPFKLEFPDLDSERSAVLKIDYNPDGSAKIYKMSTIIDGKKHKFDDVVTVRPGQSQVRTPLGRVSIVMNPAYTGKVVEPMTIVVVRRGFLSTVEKYTTKLKGDLANQDADVIDLTISDTNIARADAILNEIIKVYNEIWVENKNKLAVSTSAFIDERLKVIQSELGVVDSDISKFKSEHHLPDLEITAQAQMQSTESTNREYLTVSNELSMTSFMYDYLRDPANSTNVIPMNACSLNQVLEKQISEYNQILLARNNIAQNSSSSNPIVVEYDTQLRGLRESIVRSVIAQRAQLTAALRTIEMQQGKNDQSLADAPKQAKVLLSMERQQQVKEELYLFLLQKREENELTQTFTAYNTRVITPPVGPVDPSAPKSKLIVGLACLFGIGLPMVVLYIMMNADTKLRRRQDLEVIDVPILGEIPAIGNAHKILKMMRTKKKNQEIIDKPLFVVEEGNRNVANEAFRVVRSSLNMMFDKNKKCQIVLMTSFNPGSGKSFISYNLAASFVLKKNRVLLIDADLRHGSASNFVGKPRRGLADYLLGATNDWESLIVKGKGVADPDVLPIGKMPPNPAELLENERLGELIKEAEKDYELIIFDCPPVDIVVDAQIIEQYVDRTVFVVRAGLLEKSALLDIEKLYTTKRFKKLSLLLNGVEEGLSRYSTYGNYQNLEAKRD